MKNSNFVVLCWDFRHIIQKQIFARRDKELTKEEYQRLLHAAKRKNNRQLDLLMQTICSTGIRVSELRYITAEAIRRRQTYAVRDIVRLADILGHSSVETTRIYTIECGDIHRRQLQKLGLLLC